MTDSLKEMFATAFNKMIEDGSAQEIINKSVNDCFKEVVSDATRYNSPFRKQLEEEFKEKFCFIPERANMPIYSEIISKQIVDQFSKTVVMDHAKVVSESAIKQLTLQSKPSQKSYDFDEFLEELCKIENPSPDDTEWDDGQYGTIHMSINVEHHSCGYKWLSFSFDENITQSYQMTHRIGLDDKDRIFSVDIGKNGLNEVAVFLLKCKYAQTEIDLDGVESDSNYRVKFEIKE